MAEIYKIKVDIFDSKGKKTTLKLNNQDDNIGVSNSSLRDWLIKGGYLNKGEFYTSNRKLWSGTYGNGKSLKEIYNQIKAKK